MSIHLTRDLDSLHRDLCEMSAMVEEVLDQSLDELRRAEPGSAEKLAALDRRIDWFDIQIEEKALKVLALYQPVALDLRRIVAVLKISKELERCADLGVHIAERIETYADQVAEYGPPQGYIPKRMPEMARFAREMVRDSLDAYVELDPLKAREVCDRDDIVDELNREVLAELAETMKSMPTAVEGALSLFSVSKHVERIADLGTNIAKEAVYLVEGRIIRHRKSFPDRRPGEEFDPVADRIVVPPDDPPPLASEDEAD